MGWLWLLGLWLGFQAQNPPTAACLNSNMNPAPNGDYFVFEGQHLVGRRLYLFFLADKTLRPLEEGYTPQWSPDSQTLLFTHSDLRRLDVYRYEVARDYLDYFAFGYSPQWSPIIDYPFRWGGLVLLGGLGFWLSFKLGGLLPLRLGGFFLSLSLLSVSSLLVLSRSPDPAPPWVLYKDTRTHALIQKRYDDQRVTLLNNPQLSEYQFSPDGGALVLKDNVNLLLWRTGQFIPQHWLVLPVQIQSLQWHPDGKSIWWVENQQVYQLSTDQNTPTLIMEGDFISLSADGDTLAVSQGQTLQLLILDSKKMTPLLTVAANERIGSLVWSGDWLLFEKISQTELPQTTIANDSRRNNIHSSEIYRIRPDGTALEKLIASNQADCLLERGSLSEN